MVEDGGRKGDRAAQLQETRIPRKSSRMFWMGIACQVLMLLEIAAIFWALAKMPIHCGMILALEAANRVVKAMGSWVPARIGADESGMAAAFLAFGLPSASGLALALARRSPGFAGSGDRIHMAGTEIAAGESAAGQTRSALHGESALFSDSFYRHFLRSLCENPVHPPLPLVAARGSWRRKVRPSF